MGALAATIATPQGAVARRVLAVIASRSRGRFGRDPELHSKKIKASPVHVFIALPPSRFAALGRGVLVIARFLTRTSLRKEPFGGGFGASLVGEFAANLSREPSGQPVDDTRAITTIIGHLTMSPE